MVSGLTHGIVLPVDFPSTDLSILRLFPSISSLLRYFITKGHGTWSKAFSEIKMNTWFLPQVCLCAIFYLLISICWDKFASLEWNQHVTLCNFLMCSWVLSVSVVFCICVPLGCCSISCVWACPEPPAVSEILALTRVCWFSSPVYFVGCFEKNWCWIFF